MKSLELDLAKPGAGDTPSVLPMSIPGSGFSGDNMRLGYVKLFRKQVDWTWYKDSFTKSLFNHLVLIANHKDGEWMGVKVRRGQCITGLNSLADSLGISKQSLRTSIKRLISTREITLHPTHRFTVITICNYDIYQSRESDFNTATNTATNIQSTHCQHTANNKQECKEGEEVRERDAAPIISADVPTLADIKKHAGFVGASNAQCEEFFRHYQGNQTWINQFGKLIDVRTKLHTWVINDQQKKSQHGSKFEKPNGQVSASVQSIKDTEELKRVESAIDRVKRNASVTAMGPIYNPAEKTELNRLGNRRKELIANLGFKA